MARALLSFTWTCVESVCWRPTHLPPKDYASYRRQSYVFFCIRLQIICGKFINTFVFLVFLCILSCRMTVGAVFDSRLLNEGGWRFLHGTAGVDGRLFVRLCSGLFRGVAFCEDIVNRL